MIISKGRSYVFVHIPKTGGTSLALALEARAMRDDILIGDTPKAKRRRHRQQALPAKGRIWKHAMLSDMDGVLDAKTLENMFVFTMVRNPWDRAVSYYHWLRGQTFDHSAVHLARSLAFAEFLGHQSIQRAFEQAPARRYVTDASGIERASLYIRLEHFGRDVAPLEAHLGFSLNLPHVNASARPKDYRRFYDDRSAAVIADVCKTDIELFGYRFDSEK